MLEYSLLPANRVILRLNMVERTGRVHMLSNLNRLEDSDPHHVLDGYAILIKGKKGTDGWWES